MSALSLQGATAAVIALAVAVGLVRLWLRRLRAPAGARGPAWRAGLLTVLPVAAGAALYLTLFPPSAAAPAGALVVVTAGAPGTIARAPGERLVALPEAGWVAGAERAPDLETALRRRPDTRTVRVVGHGLAPRDREVEGVGIVFDPAPPPPGIVALAPPGPVAPGARFDAAGQIGSLPSGTVELVDPAGAVASRASVRAGERFRLSAAARAPGLALFELRLRDDGGRVVERIAVPVDASPRPQPRVLVLAGAPNAEIKFLRRWAEDVGVVLTAEIDAGGGVRLGDPPTPLTPAALAAVDLVVVDDRRWETLSAAARATLAAATADGMGLLLRPSAAPSAAVRRSWATLGLPLVEVRDRASVGLGPAEAAAASGSPVPTRLALAPAGPGTIALVRAADGRPAAGWTARGRGRVGVLTVEDSFVLQLTGRGDAYGALWSRLFSALARPEPAPAVRVDGLPRVGTRTALCGLDPAATVVEPDGRTARLLIDPASGGCAGWWPARAGWSVVRSGGREQAVYAHPVDAAPSLVAAETRAATLALAGGSVETGPERRAPGSPWPWFAALLASLGAAWGLERARFGKPPEA
jgi:hypothetical protein